MLAVGEFLWGEVDAQTRRMSTALAGGLGCSHEELCGALSGGAMIIGARYGRTEPEAGDETCNRLVCLYRERFLARYGSTRCQDIRNSGYGSEGRWPCSALVAGAASLLLGVLSEAG